MTNSFFPPVQTWRLPTTVLPASLAEMARDGAAGNEGVMLWAGQRAGDIATVTHLVALRGPGVIKCPDFIRIEDWLFNDITDVLIDLGVILVGQIHSHGVGYSTKLSPTDRTYGISAPYYLSVVAPDYGLLPNTQVTNCGVHVFEPGTGYRRLSALEVTERLEIVPGPPASIVTVGEG